MLRKPQFALALLMTSALAPASLLDARPALAQTDTQTSAWNIPAQPLSGALIRFSRASGMQLFFDATLVRGLRSPGVSGTKSRQQALSELLAGTGLTYSFQNANTVTISGRSAQPLHVPTDGSLLLETILVDARSQSAGPDDPFTADTPYETAGSLSHISRTQLDRVPASSPGDIFINTPGVIAAGNRVGTSIDPNIRGMQGMGRVKVTVDGTVQTTSSYRGYVGNRDETFIDPDMIGGVDITKGPGTGSGGGIGGSVAVRTLQPQDIIRDGKSHGFRIKGALGENGVSVPSVGTTDRRDGADILKGDNWSGSIAAAGTTDVFDYVAAVSHRVQGNYLAGSNDRADFRYPGESRENAIVRPGHEVFNTSEDTTSLLLKGKLKWADEHSLELGYNRYNSKHGEILELFFTPAAWMPDAQRALNETTVNTYTGKYRWNPIDNDLFDLRAGLWMTDLDRENASFVAEGNNVGYGSSTMRTWGADLSNASLIDTRWAPLRINTGVNFTYEDAKADQWKTYNGSTFRRWETTGPSGIRKTFAAHTSLEADLASWVTVNGGLRYDYYESSGKGYLAEFPDKAEGHISPNVGVTFKPADGVQLFALYKEGFRAPSLRETHWNYQNLLVNNPNLEGEKARDIEIGFNVLREGLFLPESRLRLKATYFDTHYTDYIVRTPVTTRQPYHWSNIEGANYRGFELSGSYDAGLWFLEAALTKYNEIEYCDGGRCSEPGDSSALGNDYGANYIPPDYSGVITAGFRLFDRKLTLGGRMQFASTSFGSDWDDVSDKSGQVGYNFTWPSYEVYDVFGSYAFNDNAVLNFSVENIQDKYYFGALASGSIPAPGRTARVSFTAKF